MEWLAIALGIVCIPLIIRQIQERDGQDKLTSHKRTAANDNTPTAQEQMAADFAEAEGYHPRADFVIGLGTPPVRRRRCRCCGKELT